jgi:hypothetical protein
VQLNMQVAFALRRDRFRDRRFVSDPQLSKHAKDVTASIAVGCRIDSGLIQAAVQSTCRVVRTWAITGWTPSDSPSNRRLQAAVLAMDAEK